MTQQRQIPAVIALIRDAHGKILLQRRAMPLIPEADEKWEFPGGTIEFGESPEDALKRECMEEIGCEVHIKRLIPFVHSNNWSRSDGVDIHAIVLCYEVEITSGVPQPSDEKVSEVGWFTEEEAATMDLLKGTKELMDRIK
jgi:8-oxo-dGTP diphosphatase